MRILYIGNFAGINSMLGYCPNAWWIAETLISLGHEVQGMDEKEYDAQQIIRELKRGKYDMILTEEGRLKDDFQHDEEHDVDIIKGYFQVVLDDARKRGIPVVAWLTNIFFGVMRREIQLMTNPIFKADIVFTTDGGHQKQFEDAGVKHVCLRQGIYEPESYISSQRVETDAEIGFIGSIYENIWKYRAELIRSLKRHYGSKFEHYGQRGDIRHAALNNLCSTLKIVVGDSVYSPHYWSNRIYEMIGRGAFFIHPRVPGLSKEFVEYEHYIPYEIGNFDELRDIIDYYLEHDDEREKIRRAGFEHCKKHHTYEKRVKKMLDILKEKNII